MITWRPRHTFLSRSDHSLSSNLTPALKVIKQATSERVLAVVPQSDLSRLVGSDSRLESQAPSVPPKVRPLVPPKQNINKSQEDINRINKVRH